MSNAASTTGQANLDFRWAPNAMVALDNGGVGFEPIVGLRTNNGDVGFEPKVTRQNVRQESRGVS
jgi:hypothetical protein